MDFNFRQFKFYGWSIYETFSTNWSYLSLHSNTFNIWKLITIVLVITGIFYCIVLKKESERIKPLALQVEKSGNWMIINQLFLGMSIVFKLNDYLIIAYVCSIMCMYSLNKLNNIFEIEDSKNLSYIHLFTRVSLGIYTGWFVYLLGFNGLPVLSKIFNIQSDDSIFFYIAILFLIISFAYIWWYSFKSKLSAILAGYTIGIFGTFFNIAIHLANQCMCK